MLYLLYTWGTFSYAKGVVQKSKAKDAALHKYLKKQTGSEPDK